MKRISKTEIKEMRSQSKKNSIMFAFTLPTVILYTIFFLVTMLIGVYYSFTDWNGISKDYTFVGLKNYVKVLTDERFREALWFNIGYTIALVVLLIVIPLTIALALNRIRRLSTLFRSIYFIPAVISMVTVGLIWNELFYRAVPAIGEMLNIPYAVDQGACPGSIGCVMEHPVLLSDTERTDRTLGGRVIDRDIPIRQEDF